MSIKWTERRYSKTLQIEEQKDFLARKNSILPSEPLEDMVCCPIHLGILERPIQLPCGHSFCLECIERCLKTHMLSNNHFACPVCRLEWPVPVDGARGWPSSYALNDIITYVQEQKQLKLNRRQSTKSNRNSILSKRKNSIIEKADLVRKLTEELANRKRLDNSVDKTHLINELNALLKRLQDSPQQAAENINRRRSSFDIKCETEVTRQQMSHMCEYRPIQEKISPMILSELLQSSFKDCLDFDADPQYRKFLFVNGKQEVVIYECLTDITTSFVPMFNSDPLKPIFLRLFQDQIFISGLIISKEDGSVTCGILVKYDLDGQVLAASDRYTKQGNNYLPIAGFDIDSDGRIFLAQPDIATITILTPDLKENEDKFVFTEPELHPEFVCYSSTTKELWASCPNHKSILILDECTGSYMQFGTTQLFDSEPRHIISTFDKKICFLDTKLSRIFWIKRQKEYLCIQRLTFGSILKKTKLFLLKGFCNSDLLLLLSEKSVLTARPINSPTAGSSLQKCCRIM